MAGACIGHGLLDERRRLELVGVERDVGIGDVGGEGEVGIAGVQVDGLRAHENGGVAVAAKRVEAVEQTSRAMT